MPDNIEIPEIWLYEDFCHDLKTPLSIQYAYLQLLEQVTEIPTQAKRYIKEIRKQCLCVAKLVRDVNDGTRLSHGMIPPRFVNGDIVALTQSIIDDARVLTDLKHVHIHFVNRVPARIMAVDKQIIERILLNLLSNAKQYSEENGIIDVTLWEMDGCMHISVRDYGPGIPPGMDVFARYAGSEIDHGTHTGLGLYIVRQLAALLGGDVYLTDVTQGAEVTLRLPVFTTDMEEQEVTADDFFADNMMQMELAF